VGEEGIQDAPIAAIRAIEKGGIQMERKNSIDHILELKGFLPASRGKL